MEASLNTGRQPVISLLASDAAFLHCRESQGTVDFGRRVQSVSATLYLFTKRRRVSNGYRARVKCTAARRQISGAAGRVVSLLARQVDYLIGLHLLYSIGWRRRAAYVGQHGDDPAWY